MKERKMIYYSALTFWALQAAANGRTSWGCAAWRSRRHRAHIAILQRAQYKVTASPLWSLQTGVPSGRDPLPPLDCQLPLGGPRLWAASGPLFGWQDSLHASQYKTWKNNRFLSVCSYFVREIINCDGAIYIRFPIASIFTISNA